jgi:hypothetical protein
VLFRIEQLARLLTCFDASRNLNAPRSCGAFS